MSAVNIRKLNIVVNFKTFSCCYSLKSTMKRPLFKSLGSLFDNEISGYNGGILITYF